MTDVQRQDANGSTAYGKAAVNGILKEEGKASAPKQTSQEDVQLVLQSFRLLIADLCQQFGMGKYGVPISPVLYIDGIQGILVELLAWQPSVSRSGNMPCAMHLTHRTGSTEIDLCFRMVSKSLRGL